MPSSGLLQDIMLATCGTGMRQLRFASCCLGKPFGGMALFQSMALFKVCQLASGSSSGMRHCLLMISMHLPRAPPQTWGSPLSWAYSGLETLHVTTQAARYPSSLAANVATEKSHLIGLALAEMQNRGTSHFM